MKRLVACLTVVVFALGAGRAGAASFQGLGDLPEGTVDSFARGVSADGSVVVGYSNSASDIEGFRWTAGGGMVGLGDLPGGTLKSYAYGVSADGSVVVGFGYSASGAEAFRWTAGGGMVGLGDLPGGIFSSVAYGVSGDGSVVVGHGRSASDKEAFRWTAGGGMVGLGDLPGGSIVSRANGVSADGSVVAGYGDSALGYEAFRWTAGGGMVGLGDLPGGLFYSAGNAVSADGSVLVGLGFSASGQEAFRWTQGGGMVGLGDLPGGSFGSAAYGVSADGSVLVGRGNSGLVGDEAFIWDETNGMRSLNDVLTTEFGLDLTGWTLTFALAVSPNGRAIAGHGWNPSSDVEAWLVLLDPLELYWVNRSGGAWDTSSNWDFVHPATEMTGVFVQPDTGLTVIGPAATTTIKSLTIGAQTGGTATLELQNTGTLFVNEMTTITARGKITGDGTLDAAGVIENYGEIDLGSSSLQLVGGTLTNHGLIRGNGQIDNSLRNEEDGEVRGQSGQRILFTGANNWNGGEIDLDGGTVEFAQNLVNYMMDDKIMGFITGRGELRVEGGLSNEGTMAFSGGFTEIHGDVTNNLLAKIVISGGSTTTFYDDVHNYSDRDPAPPDLSGELRISLGSNAVFFGGYKGAGTTGTGTAYMEGDLRPGDSPAEISFGGDLVFGSTAGLEIELADPDDGPANDRLDVVGDVYLDGALTVEALSNLGTVGDILRTIITAAGPVGLSGTFAQEPGVGEHLGYGVFHQGVSYEMGAVDLSVLQALAGDTDGNRDVSFADFNDLANNYTGAGGSGKDWTQGDFDGDGDVDFADFNNLANNYTGTGVEYASGKAAVAPEPGTLVLLGGGAIGLLLAIRRRGRGVVGAKRSGLGRQCNCRP